MHLSTKVSLTLEQKVSKKLRLTYFSGNEMELLELQSKRWYGVYKELDIEIPAINDMPLGERIAKFANDIGESPALTYFNKLLTYSELEAESNKLANALSDSGIGTGDVIGLHLVNIPAYVIAIAAISKLGAIGTGMSPLLAPSELVHQMQDANVKLLLTLETFLPTLEAVDAFPASIQSIVVASPQDYLVEKAEVKLPSIGSLPTTSFTDFMEGQPGTFTPVASEWNDTFMIQYTGGTTGRPKGAQLSIRNLMHNPVSACAADPKAEFGKDVYATAFPFFHVAGLSSMIAALIDGMNLLLIPNARDTDNFCDMMVATPPTILAAVPALFEMLMANEKFKAVDFSRLKSVKSGGAPMPSDTASRLVEYIGEQRLVDVFGMTETGPAYTMHPQIRRKEGSVGVPAPGADVRIISVDDRVTEMPIGGAGEICSSGFQIMKGYLNLPDETENALRELDGKRWMFSGDIGYMDEEGYIFLCDRAKDMLIVGGFKVFSVEVEDKLSALPQIAASAIIGSPDTKRPGNDIVNLFVQLNPDYASADKTAIQVEIVEFCRKKMAAYKVPKVIYFIDEIPLTAVGKIDKKVLRKQLNKN